MGFESMAPLTIGPLALTVQRQTFLSISLTEARFAFARRTLTAQAFSFWLWGRRLRLHHHYRLRDPSGCGRILVRCQMVGEA